MKKIIVILCCFFAMQFLGIPVSRAETGAEKKIALTFDDGPRPDVLAELLPLLKTHAVPATFFIIGSIAKDNPDTLLRLAQGGHEIENHSYGHENMRLLEKKKGISAVLESIEKTDAVVDELTGRSTYFFRPPYWEISQLAIQRIEHAGFEVLTLEHPDINTLDYDDATKKRSHSALVKRVMGIVEQREKRHIFTHVLVFHELRLTVEALREIIPLLKGKGYAFVRLRALSCFPFCK